MAASALLSSRQLSLTKTSSALPPRPTSAASSLPSLPSLPLVQRRQPRARHSFNAPKASASFLPAIASGCRHAPRRTLSAPAKLRPNWQRAAGSRSAAIVAQWNVEVQFSPAKITQSASAAQGLQQIFIDVGAEVAAGYKKAGQYVQIKVGESKPGFFAIASAPSSGSGVLEFLIKSQPASTAELLVGLPEGGVVQVSSVMGKGFPIERVPPTDAPTLLMFATGSGISPIKALMESGALEADKRADVRLYYGTRSAEVTAYQELIPKWESSGVKVVQVFSQSNKAYVQDVFANNTAIKDPAGVAIVVCGQKGMVEGLKKVLEAEGVPADRVLANF